MKYSEKKIKILSKINDDIIDHYFIIHLLYLQSKYMSQII